MYLRALGDHIVHEDHLTAAGIVGSRKEHTVTVYACDTCGLKVCNNDYLLSDKLVGCIVVLDARYDHALVYAGPIFVAYVRESRYTKTLLDETGEFTVNIPLDSCDPKILGYCGSRSGRDCDKTKDLQLTLEEPRKIQVPGIKELPLTLECKVIYRQLEDMRLLPSDIQDRFYSEGDPHIAYYGQILDAYIIED